MNEESSESPAQSIESGTEWSSGLVRQCELASDLIQSRGRSVRAKSVLSDGLFPTDSFNPLRTPR